MAWFSALLRQFDALSRPAWSAAPAHGEAVDRGQSRFGGAVPSSVAMLVAANAAGVVLLLWATGLRLDGGSIVLIVTLLSLALGSMLSHGKLTWRHEESLRAAVSAMSIFAAIALTGAMASYPVAALTSGYHDATLHAIDLWMGFDWLAAYSLVAAHPSLQLLGVLAYRSIYVTPVLLLGYWAITEQLRVSNRFLFEFWLAVVITLVLFFFMPAQGALAYLWSGDIPYMPDSRLCQPQLIPELRLENIPAIKMTELCGLVSAPSFHAAAAVLYFRSAFRAGSMKWPVLVLSTAMLVSTPVEGTHYLIDILMGMAVAAFVLAVVEVATGRRAAG